MSLAQRPVCDQAVRDRVVTDLGTTFLLEASAGTGKTSVLVGRYVACVLDPGHGTRDVRRVAAITFTEKAAGELRQRIRERFEELSASAADPEQAKAVGDALEALDDAPINTIHGFAGRLLREFSVEAGIDPAFEQLDPLGSELELARLWDEWLTELAAGGPEHDQVRGWLRQLLQIGVRLGVVRELAVGSLFGERYDIDPAPEPPPPPDIVAGLTALLGPVIQLREYCVNQCTDQTDGGFAQAMDLLLAFDACTTANDMACDLDKLAANIYGLPVKTGKNGPGGRQASWLTGRDGKQEFLDRYKTVAQGVTVLRDAFSEHVTGLAVSVADAFARWAGAAQLAAGRLDFTDLLGQLRDLLARDLATRGALQRRFDYILVDEFQDTDPLQAECVFLLCEREPKADEWRRAELEPGKLFVVGDPKQSIYRFRRADISLYDEVKRLVETQPHGKGERLVITQNFRTTPLLVDWVNTVFDEVFELDREAGRQPGYDRVEAYRPPVEGPRVAALVGRRYGRETGETDAAHRDEALALAALVREIHDEGHGAWDVCDRRRQGGEDEASRQASWGDVAILVRTTTPLETYEQAMREAGIPYRVEGGKTYFRRREVTDALLCLRAVDDPGDGPAVYGALHSSLFGFSDDDLIRFWGAGGRFDPFSHGQPEGENEVANALALLRALHERRGELEIDGLLEDLLGVTQAETVLAATGDGAVQALANLDKLVERARAFREAGGGGLGAFIKWAAEAEDAAGEQESQAGDDGDVVHVLTIHRAKGLEYPIVVLAGAALGGGGGSDGVVIDRAHRRAAVKVKVDLPGMTQELVPRAFEELKKREDAMEASEARRLLYVALTRARDRLVLSCYGAVTTLRGEPAAVLLGPLHRHLPPPASVAERCVRDGLLLLGPVEAPARPDTPAVPDLTGATDVMALLAAREQWSRERALVLERAATPAPATSPSALEQVDEAVRAGGPGAPAGRAAALALGSAVHRIMELCDFADPESPGRLAGWVCADLGRPDLADRAAELAQFCWGSPVVREAGAAAEAYRELPVGMLIDDVIVSGVIDLLYGVRGEWVVVDYKTDRAADAAVLRERYEPQGAAYALAVEAATGGVVRAVVFVAAAAGLEIAVTVTDDLRRGARQDIVRTRARRLMSGDVVE